MKRIIALFAVFALVFCLTFVPVKAEGTAWSLPFSKIETLLDLAEQLFSGAEVNLAEISNQALGLYEFILDYEYYLNENDIYVPTLSMSQADALRIGLSSLALNGENELTALSDLTIPIKAEDIAHFINYSSDWIKRYKPNTSDVVIPTPDVNYISYLNTINSVSGNGLDFFFMNYSIPNTLNNQYSFNPSFSSFKTHSYYSYDTRGIVLSPYNTTALYFSNSIVDVRIYSVGNDTYTFDTTFTSVNCGTTDFGNGIPQQNNSLLFTNNVLCWNGIGVQPAPFSVSYSGYLNDLLNYVSKHFRNINIYVDGVLWASADTLPVDPFLQLGAVALGDLGTSTFPVYTLDQEGDLGLDVGAFANWLDGVIKSGATAISLGDVIADGIAIVDTETGERAVTDDDAEDVAKVIAGVQVTTAPAPSGSPTPSPTPEPKKPIIPPLKIIPPLLDPALRPSDIPRQTTVLSEIIDATNKTVPQDIMILFWSTIGLLVVGGLIYIMHK